MVPVLECHWTACLLGLFIITSNFLLKATPQIYTLVTTLQSDKPLFAHFGHKWDKLFRGSMWSYDGESSEDETTEPQAEIPTEDLLALVVIETAGLAEPMSEVHADANEDVPAASPELSLLWSGLCSHHKEELEQASVLPQQIEELHNVSPTKTMGQKKTQRDPMKVYSTF